MQQFSAINVTSNIFHIFYSYDSCFIQKSFFARLKNSAIERTDWLGAIVQIWGLFLYIPGEDNHAASPVFEGMLWLIYSQ